MSDATRVEGDVASASTGCRHRLNLLVTSQDAKLRGAGCLATYQSRELPPEPGDRGRVSRRGSGLIWRCGSRTCKETENRRVLAVLTFLSARIPSRLDSKQCQVVLG